MSMTVDLFIRMLYALGVGVLIGLERSVPRPPSARGVPHDPDEDTDPAPAPPATAPDPIIGIRTCTVLSLVGFIAAFVGVHVVPAGGPVILAGAVLLVLALYWRSDSPDPGITTEIAAVGSVGLGALCWSHPHAAGVLALLVTVMLASKRFVQQTVSGLRRVELTGTLQLLVIVLIVLPLLPNEALDPYGAFNPHKVVLLVVLISGIGFVGYFLTKYLGADKGLGLTGLLGGLTSSTAVTAAMAQQAKQFPTIGNACAVATVIANATMFARVLVVVFLLDRVLFMDLAWGLGTMTAAAALGVGVLWLLSRRKETTGPHSDHEDGLSNPFSIGPAVKFAGFFVLILFVAKLAKLWFGDSGIYLASLVSGLADVDAITLTIAEQTRDGTLLHSVGALGITLAVAANSVVKTGIAFYSGGARFGATVGLVLGLATGAGIAVLLLV
jgi:uncharacterized membrane protein (DUF4010 family)